MDDGPRERSFFAVGLDAMILIGGSDQISKINDELLVRAVFLMDPLPLLNF